MQEITKVIFVRYCDVKESGNLKALIDSKSFRKLMYNAKAFLCKDDNKPILQWVQLHINKEDKKIRAYSCDGYGLISLEDDCMGIDDSFECFVKPFTFKSKFNSFVELELIDNKLFVTVGETIFGFRQPKDKALNIVKLIEDRQKEEKKYSAAFDPAKLIKALTPYVGNNKPVVLEFSEPIYPVLITSEFSKNKTMVAAVKA